MRNTLKAMRAGGERHPQASRPTETEAAGMKRQLATAVDFPGAPATRAEARGAAASLDALSVEVLQELVCCELGLLLPPLRGAVVAGDQPHPVQTAEVAIDERVVCLRLLGRASWFSV